MKIIHLNGKSYLDTYIVKIDNNWIDAAKLFDDMENCLDQYGDNADTIKAVYKKFDASYFSPSFLVGYLENPGLSLINSIISSAPNPHAVTGTVFHKILEEYYKLPHHLRSRKYQLFELKKQHNQPEIIVETLDSHLNGYIQSLDYLYTGKPIDDKKLDCATEYKAKDTIKIKSLNEKLPMKLSYIVDRLDFRPQGVYIIDYKTGTLNETSPTFNGFLSQMILYKWGAEQAFDVQVSSGYLMEPKRMLYQELDFSKENEKLMLDKVHTLYRSLNRDAQSRLYQYTHKGGLYRDEVAYLDSIMKDETKKLVQIPIKIPISYKSDEVV